MTTVIPNHSHCRVCQKAVAFGDETCSKKCAGELTAVTKRRKQTLLILYGGIAAFMIILVLQLLGAA